MPISFQQIDQATAVRWRQSYTSPCVFLDVWAIREISESVVARERLSRALNEKQGTLFLTLHLIAEFSNFDDPKHAHAADLLVISALPNVYLAQVDENFLSGIELQEGVSASTPPAAHEILNALAAKGDISLAARLGTLFAEMYNIRESLQIISEDAAVKIQNSLFELSSNQSYKKKSKFSDLDDSRTLEFKLLGELLREAILNTKKISKNDVIDIIHAVLAIRYCDFVLLDSKWADIVEKIRHRSRKKTTNLKLPYVFSRQNNGIESFLHKLENF